MSAAIVELPDHCCATPFESIDDVIGRMREIKDALPESDGLACFNRMYLAMTEAVKAAVDHGLFSDSAFLARLDVVFANRYLLAVQASAGRDVRAPHCWMSLIERRASTHISSMQFALAGMTSHIAYDLVLSVVQTLQEWGGEPDAVRDDYTRVNTIIEKLEPGVRHSMEHGHLVEDIERHAGSLLTAMGNWSIAAARKAAFVDAEMLWAVRRHHDLARGYEHALDAATTLANDCMLMPAFDLKMSYLGPVHAFWHGEHTPLPGLNRLRHRTLSVVPAQQTVSDAEGAPTSVR